jgi:hypothetical protein
MILSANHPNFKETLMHRLHSGSAVLFIIKKAPISKTPFYGFPATFTIESITLLVNSVEPF